MPQHFLLTAAARTLSLASIFRMSDDEAHDTFTAIRFADNGGGGVLPALPMHGGLHLRGTAHLEVQSLQPPVQRHVRHDLCQPQARDP